MCNISETKDTCRTSMGQNVIKTVYIGMQCSTLRESINLNEQTSRN